jgi:hypothetical protein
MPDRHRLPGPRGSPPPRSPQGARQRPTAASQARQEGLSIAFRAHRPDYNSHSQLESLVKYSTANRSAAGAPGRHHQAPLKPHAAGRHDRGDVSAMSTGGDISEPLKTRPVTGRRASRPQRGRSRAAGRKGGALQRGYGLGLPKRMRMPDGPQAGDVTAREDTKADVSRRNASALVS